MKKFNDFKIDQNEGRFVGKKISIDDLINQQVIVQNFKTEPSKYNSKGSGIRTVIQIQFQDKQRIIFTNSVILRDTLEKIRRIEKGFPFETCIEGNMKEGYRFS